MLVRLDHAAVPRLEPDGGKDVRALVCASAPGELLAIRIHRRKAFSHEDTVPRPRRDVACGAGVTVVGVVVVGILLAVLDADDVIRAAIVQRALLLRRNHVVGRCDGGGEVGARGIVAQAAEWAGISHDRSIGGAAGRIDRSGMKGGANL